MQKTINKNDFKDHFESSSEKYTFYSINKLQSHCKNDLTKLPYSHKVLLENLLRNFDNKTVTLQDLLAFDHWLDKPTSEHEITFRPSRVLMQDFTGVPAVVDLAAMRDKLEKSGRDPKQVNPQTPVDLVIDHSIQVDHFGTPDAMELNTQIEVKRNKERYEFLKCGQSAFDNFRVVPPGTGICHQINLEYFANVIWDKNIDGELIAFPDTLVGTDSHTTMINGLGVLGWGVGGIEAEAVILGQPISLIIPDVVGFNLTGQLKEGITATDLILTITKTLRSHGVVGKFVEFYGKGLRHLSLADRATIANMATEYGATCGFFPIDEVTTKYLDFTGRKKQVCSLVKDYSIAQGLWFEEQHSTIYSETINFDLNQVEPSIAGPYRPQDRAKISELPQLLKDDLSTDNKTYQTRIDNDIQHGSIVIASITSCTNTSNPAVLISAGLLAKKAIDKGLSQKPWVKTSLAPGSKVVTEYLKATGLQPYLDKLGFNLVAYGCTTCIGNSGPLSEDVQKKILDNDLTVASVLSGNRNFSGRINPLTKLNWLTSPPLVVAYALIGSIDIDLLTDSLGNDNDGNPVYLKDIWPSNKEIQDMMEQITKEMFIRNYSNVYEGDQNWKQLNAVPSTTYNFDPDSTYIRKPHLS